MISIDGALASDAPAIEHLLDQRFGLERHRLTAYGLRKNTTPISELCFVARKDSAVIGSAQSWPIRLRGSNGSSVSLVLVGPVAVARSHEGAGLGSALTRALLARADAGGFARQLLVGDASFYGRFGFSSGAGDAWELPGPVDRARLLLRGDIAALPKQGFLEADPSAGNCKTH